MSLLKQGNPQVTAAVKAGEHSQLFDGKTGRIDHVR